MVNDSFLDGVGPAAFAPEWSVRLGGLQNGLYDVYLYDPALPAIQTGSRNAKGVAFSTVNGN